MSTNPTKAYSRRASPTLRVQAARNALETLVQERQRLRLDGDDRRRLESNRRAIVRRQRQLAHALILEHATSG